MNSIAPEKLVRLIGVPGAPVIVDVRAAETSRMIPGSIRFAPQAVEAWSGALAGSAVVVDEDGASSAQGIAAWLRTEESMPKPWKAASRLGGRRAFRFSPRTGSRAAMRSSGPSG
ncbi:hypothetical protein PIB19_07275 [Sphingomonas sp. 7/4-4]|uniref:hypothetical protein n=1 Tax=Sphingomonas sp. 7/4-4 TaxID=3018446 RepID=UPI0022F405AC|nr:hypothetical protein [Sphingomonas sp. 7/4-4]WBY09148.1 hypothetical protein PIB19_07275 [Sphingomonas sp. 7/4-4]